MQQLVPARPVLTGVVEKHAEDDGELLDAATRALGVLRLVCRSVFYVPARASHRLLHDLPSAR
jgi:hypothetical protein